MPYLNTIRLFHLTLLPQLYECPPCQTFGAQTEFDLDLFSSSRTGTSAGTNACTQVDEKDVSRLKLLNVLPLITIARLSDYDSNRFFCVRVIFLKPDEIKMDVILQKQNKLLCQNNLAFGYIIARR